MRRVLVLLLLAVCSAGRGQTPALLKVDGVCLGMSYQQALEARGLPLGVEPRAQGLMELRWDNQHGFPTGVWFRRGIALQCSGERISLDGKAFEVGTGPTDGWVDRPDLGLSIRFGRPLFYWLSDSQSCGRRPFIGYLVSLDGNFLGARRAATPLVECSRAGYACKITGNHLRYEVPMGHYSINVEDLNVGQAAQSLVGNALPTDGAAWLPQYGISVRMEDGIVRSLQLELRDDNLLHALDTAAENLGAGSPPRQDLTARPGE